MTTEEQPIILKVDGLTKRFGGLIAVNDMSFEVPRGQILGIIGPNGAGKSTLFNLMSGVARPTSGHILLRGDDITGKSSNAMVAHGLAKTFQLAVPMRHMTVRQVLSLAAHSPQARKAADKVGIDTYVRAIADDLGIVRLLDNYAEKVNAAALRLVDIGRAMATNPSLLLLDEPFSSLSNEEIERVSQVIRDLLAKGLTIVIVEHKLPGLMRLVDEVVVMNFGQKIAYASPEEVVEQEAVIEAYLGTKAVRMFGGSS